MTRRPLILVPLLLLAALALWLAFRHPSIHASPAKGSGCSPDTSSASRKAPEPQPEPAAKAQDSALRTQDSAAPYSPPPVHDPRLAALVDRNAKNRLSSDMSSRLPTANPDDFPALLSVVSDTKDGDTERHEVIELLKRSKCPDLPETLAKVLDNPDGEAPLPCLRHAAPRRPGQGSQAGDQGEHARQDAKGVGRQELRGSLPGVAEPVPPEGRRGYTSRRQVALRLQALLRGQGRQARRTQNLSGPES